MDYLVVRTKLQAFIALELLGRGVISRPFVFVPLYRTDINEDSESVRLLYKRIASLACREEPMVQATGLVKNTARLTAHALRCTLSGGTFFAAVVNLYPLALALKLIGRVKFVSFDDGTANTQVRSDSYHTEEPLPGNGLKRAVARWLFPQGAAKYVRSRIDKHYTIFPGRRNIVPEAKLATLKLDWSTLARTADLEALRLPVSAVLIGSVYAEIPDSRVPWLYQWALERSDLYLPHPRQPKRPPGDIQVIDCGAPAESVIDYLLDRTEGALTLYHFNSSVALTYEGHRRIISVDLLAVGDSIGSTRPRLQAVADE